MVTSLVENISLLNHNHYDTFPIERAWNQPETIAKPDYIRLDSQNPCPPAKLIWLLQYQWLKIGHWFEFFLKKLAINLEN